MANGPPDVVELFVELAEIPSPSGQEAAVAEHVRAYLRDLALPVEEDEAGNLLARVEPAGGGTPLFLCAHLDTVPATAPIEPLLEDGMIRNAAATILGADNKAAVAVMLEAARRVVAENRPHAGIELLFTLKEEVGLRGAAAFDEQRLRAKVGYVYDHAGPIGEVILGAPYQTKIDLTFRGREAHAGMYPEDGRSAIAAAARAVSDFRLGRLDEETSANVGEIRGGTARNVVPAHCVLAAEARSHDASKLAELVEEMLETASFAAQLGECDVEIGVEQSARGYRFRRDAEPVRLAAAALARAGVEASYGLSGGGADANVFNQRGLQCVNLANGMIDIHTSDERIAVEDLERMVDVTLALVETARDAA